MNIEELEEALDELLPNRFSIEHLNNGQIVIYTGLIQDDDGELVPSEIEESEDLDEDTELLEDEDDED